MGELNKYLNKVLREEKDEAKRKAFDALGRYKFLMFGYWAGVWVHLNKLDPGPQPNPFTDLVKMARDY